MSPLRRRTTAVAPAGPSGSTPLPDIASEARRIAAAATEAGLPLRLIGGVAICVHAHGGVHPALARSYGDIDLVTTPRGGRDAQALLQQLGYRPNERFNALHGARRLVVYDTENGRQIDVFVGEFSMCHTLPISARLEQDPQTVPLAELLLTKLQIVQLNAKDVADIHQLVFDHDVGEDDTESINGPVFASLLAQDWGLWRTTRDSLATARERLGMTGLSAAERTLVSDRLERLWERVDIEPKSVRWRARSRVGDRVRWYEEPEEIAHPQPSG